LKKRLNLARTKLPRRQADVMNHQDRDLTQRPLIKVGRRAVSDTITPATGGVQLHTKLLDRSLHSSAVPPRGQEPKPAETPLYAQTQKRRLGFDLAAFL
jgi:hypothetical protein